MSEFKLPDPKKNAGRFLGICAAGGIGLAVYYYLLPFLNTIVWGSVELIIGCAILGVLGFILLNPTFWKRTRIILEALGELLFKWVIEMNPFAIMELQVSKAEKDREELKRQAEKLKAQEDKLRVSLEEEKEALQLAQEKIHTCKNRVAQHPQDYQAPLELESVTNDFNNSMSYIQNVTPIYQDVVKLVLFADKAYTKSEYALKDARNTIRKQRATYDAVTAGSSAMKKALRAFTGDPEINKAAATALEALKRDISNKVGVIKNSIQLTSQIMNERDLNDAAKVSLAVKKAEALSIDASFEVVTSTLGNPNLQRIPETVYSKNKYLDQLK